MSFGKRGTNGNVAAQAVRRPARLVQPTAAGSDRLAFAGDDLATRAVPAETTGSAVKKRRLVAIVLVVALFWPLFQMVLMKGARNDLEAGLGKPNENGFYSPVSSTLKPRTPAANERRSDPPAKIVNMLAGDPEITAARSKARASLDTFWAKLAKPDSGEDNFTLKASLPTAGGSLEHIWVADIKRDGDIISARLSNEPRDLAGLKMGSPVTFHEQQISDWSFRRKGKIVGNETMRPLIAKLPPAEAARYREMLEQP